MERMMCPAKERIARIVQRKGVAYDLVIMCTRYAKNVCKIMRYLRTDLQERGMEKV